MTAPFAASLCGYRGNGNPSTSDNGDKGSIEWGHALFHALGVPVNRAEVQTVGAVMESYAARHLASLRPDLTIQQSKPASTFEQYQHLQTFRTFKRSYRQPDLKLAQAIRSLGRLPQSDAVAEAINHLQASEAEITANHSFVTQLIDTMPEESMLSIDITVSPEDSKSENRLLVGLSSKWSLRTDRAQDCIAQGAKLVSMRRGHMPHYAVLTMEPRPSMLKLLAYGSGSVDCVYHLALPELRAAAQVIEAARGKAWPQRHLLEQMVTQRRIRPYQDLVDEINRLPAW